jgi:hypothetical protein
VHELVTAEIGSSLDVGEGIVSATLTRRIISNPRMYTLQTDQFAVMGLALDDSSCWSVCGQDELLGLTGSLALAASEGIGGDLVIKPMGARPAQALLCLRGQLPEDMTKCYPM